MVCAANRCRSPAIVSVLVQGAGGRPGLGSGVRVSSAGTMDDSGVPVDKRTRKALRRAGYRAPDVLSRTISPQMIASADLVLTASRRHRTQVVRMAPDALPKTYTFREFARYCAGIPSRSVGTDAHSSAEQLRSVVDLANRKRGMSFPRACRGRRHPRPQGALAVGPLTHHPPHREHSGTDPRPRLPRGTHR